MWGSHLISLVNVDQENGEAFDEEVESIVTKILIGKPYLCSALKQGKNTGIVGDGKFEYDKGLANLAERGTQDHISWRVKEKEILQVT